MEIIEFKELKKKSVSDLHKLLAEARDRLRELRFKDANKQLKDIRSIRKLRAMIAQAITLVNSHRLDKDINKSNKEIEK
jgi:ribosomal protein L29